MNTARGHILSQRDGGWVEEEPEMPEPGLSSAFIVMFNILILRIL